jgi:hypothetical protein
MTHRASAPCPYKDDNNPIGMLATCCSFRANAVALYLFAMGSGPLAVRLFEGKLPEQAIEFADQLHATATKYRNGMMDAAKKAGKRVDPFLTGLTAQIPDVDWEFSIAKALQMIEACAKWHEKTGRMLCGVRAWA